MYLVLKKLLSASSHVERKAVMADIAEAEAVTALQLLLHDNFSIERVRDGEKSGFRVLYESGRTVYLPNAKMLWIWLAEQHAKSNCWLVLRNAHLVYAIAEKTPKCKGSYERVLTKAAMELKQWYIAGDSAVRMKALVIV